MKNFILVLLSVLALQGCESVSELMTHRPEVTYFTPETADKFMADATAVPKAKGSYRSIYMSRLTELLMDGTYWTCNSLPYLITVDGIALEPPVGNNIAATAVSLGGCQKKLNLVKMKGKFDGEFIYLRGVDNPHPAIYKYKPQKKDSYGAYELTWVGTIWLEDGVPKLTAPRWMELGKFGTWNYGSYRDSHERSPYKSEPYMKEPGSVSDLVQSMKQDYDYAVEYQAKDTADTASYAAKIRASNAQAAREIDADMANFMRNKTNEINRTANTLNKITAPVESSIRTQNTSGVQSTQQGKNRSSENSSGSSGSSGSNASSLQGGGVSAKSKQRIKMVEEGFNDGGARAATPELAIEKDIAQLKLQAKKWVAERGNGTVHGVILDTRVRKGCTAYKQLDQEGGYWAKCVLDFTWEADKQ